MPSPADDLEQRLNRFLGELRAERGAALPSRGLGRFARTLRGGVGMAAQAWLARRKGAAFDEASLRSVEQLVARLGELKGLPMKLGQILGYLEADLPEEMRRTLALLQTQSQPMLFASVERIVREDLGDRAGALLAALDRTPVSVASIGQVHRAALPEGWRAAVKVRHPDIDQAIRSDFRGAAAGTAFANLIMPGAGATAREVVAEAEARLLEECDYALEARRQQRFGELFANHPDVVVPRVLPDWCGARVLTTAWEDGRDFDSFAAAASQDERDRAGRALFEVYIGTLYRAGLFHADPHPGNYRFRDGGQVVVFDYGCVRAFDPPEVLAFVQLAAAVRDSDDTRMRTALTGLGAAPPQDPKAFAHVRGLMHGFFAPMLSPGAHRIDGHITIDARQMMKDKLAMVRMRLPGKLLFLIRIRFGLYSVLARLGSVADWSALEQGYADTSPLR